MVGRGATQATQTQRTTMTRKNDKQNAPELKALMVQNLISCSR